MASVQFYFEKALDIGLIGETFRKSFSQEFNVETWKWRFLKNKNDEKIFISYIIEEGKLAAYYAVSPSILRFEGNQYKVALSNMTMTHPDFQGKGYFKLLANELYSKLKDNNYIGVYGFANANSHYGFRKYLNWNDLTILNIFKTTPQNFRSFLIKDNDSIKFEDESLNNINVKLLNGTNVSSHKIEINRDLLNYKWRLIDIPEKSYRLLIVRGNNEVEIIIAYKFFNNEIDIIEVFNAITKTSDFLQLLGCSIKHLINKYEMPINIWSNLYEDEHLYLEKIGFKETVFNTYFGFIPLSNNNALLDVKNWHYRLYDSDIF